MFICGGISALLGHINANLLLGTGIGVAISVGLGLFSHGIVSIIIKIL